jgi:hypothetical protein
MDQFILTVLLFVAVAWVSFRIGYWYRGIRILRELSRQLLAQADRHNQLVSKLASGNVDQMVAGLDEAAKVLNMTLLKHEEIGGRHFFYSKDTDTFMAQGDTLEEAALHYGKNHRTIGCVADPTKQSDSYFIVDGRITTELVK